MPEIQRRLDEARRELVERYAVSWPDPSATVAYLFPRLYRMARDVGLSPEDIRSVAWAGVVHAAGRFDASRGASFATYANIWIRSSVRREVDKAYAGRLVQLVPDEVFGDTPLNHLPARSDRRVECDLAETVEELLRQLPGRYRRVLEMRFGLGAEGYPMTDIEVAEVLGISRQRVQQIQAMALDRIRVPAVLALS